MASREKWIFGKRFIIKDALEFPVFLAIRKLQGKSEQLK